MTCLSEQEWAFWVTLEILDLINCIETCIDLYKNCLDLYRKLSRNFSRYGFVISNKCSLVLRGPLGAKILCQIQQEPYWVRLGPLSPKLPSSQSQSAFPPTLVASLFHLPPHVLLITHLPPIFCLEWWHPESAATWDQLLCFWRRSACLLQCVTFCDSQKTPNTKRTLGIGPIIGCGTSLIGDFFQETWCEPNWLIKSISRFMVKS